MDRKKNALRLQKLLLASACVAYLFIHAFVPAGFMLAGPETDQLYKLCHGDAKSVALLERIASAETLQAGHQHHDPHNPHDHLGLNKHEPNGHEPNTSTSHIGEHCASASMAAVAIEAQDTLAVPEFFHASTANLRAVSRELPQLLRNVVQARAPPLTL